MKVSAVISELYTVYDRDDNNNSIFRTYKTRVPYLYDT